MPRIVVISDLHLGALDSRQADYLAAALEEQQYYENLDALGYYDDFDGSRHREAKEACIVYPSTTQGAPTPTLQWEGIREGIDDYRYAHTLREMAKKVGGHKARDALATLDRLMASVPVRTHPGDFTAADAQRLRTRLAALIQSLTNP